MSEIKTLSKGDMLFFEGDPSDAMYVIRKGRIAIMKNNDDIVLAELRVGQLLGEMAFFDRRARSAGAKALEDSEVLVLPFTALTTQYENFPSWLKIMMKTINSYLREANQKIRLFEADQKDKKQSFPTKLTSQLSTIINLLSYKLGQSEDDGVSFSTLSLRTYVNNSFFLSNYKLQLFIDILVEQELVRLDSVVEQKVVVLNPEFFDYFVEWYTKYLQIPEEERISFRDKELEMLTVLIQIGEEVECNEEGLVSLPISDIISSAFGDYEVNLTVNHIDIFETKGIVESDVMDQRHIIFSPERLYFVYLSWHLLNRLKKVPYNA